LYNYLQQHPEIYLPKIKETNYFSRFDIDKNNLNKLYALDIGLNIDKYFSDGMKDIIHIAHIEKWEDYKKLYSLVDSEKAVGDFSNSYSCCPSAASSIYKKFPEAKIVFMLRNPLTRIWSHYLMNIRESKTIKKDFLQEVFSDHESDLNGWGVNHQYLKLGLYYQQVKKYIELFSKDQVKILFFEDYVRNPPKINVVLFKFLNVDTTFALDYSEKYNEASLPRFELMNKLLVNSGLIKILKDVVSREKRQKLKRILYSNKRLPVMDETSKQQLIKFYKEDVNNLSGLLNIDLAAKWNF